jgi:hypothetical protein
VPSGQIDVRRARAGSGVASDLLDRCAERIEDAAQRHVLAERHPAHLHVLVDDVAAGSDDDLGVDPRILGDTDSEWRVQAIGLGDDVEIHVGSVEHRDVDRVLGPEDEVEIGVVGDRSGRGEVALGDQARRHLECTRALLATALDGGDVQLLAGVLSAGSHDAQHQDRDDGEQRDRAVRSATGPRPEPARECRDTRRRARQREPQLEHHPGQQDDAADPDHAHQRAADLRHAHRGERDPTEREREPHRLDQRMSRWSPDHPPRTDRSHQRSAGVEQGEHQPGDEISGQGQLHHPAHSQVHPSRTEQQPQSEPLAPGGVFTQGHLEQHHAHDRQRPESPRWHRQRHQRARTEGERRSGEALAERSGGAWRSWSAGGSGVSTVNSTVPG